MSVSFRTLLKETEPSSWGLEAGGKVSGATLAKHGEAPGGREQASCSSRPGSASSRGGRRAAGPRGVPGELATPLFPCVPPRLGAKPEEEVLLPFGLQPSRWSEILLLV